MNVRTREAFLTAIGSWDTGRPVAVDYETNGHKVWHPASRLAGIGLAGFDVKHSEPTGIYIPLAHQRGQNCDPALLGDVVEFLSKMPLIAFSLEMEVPWSVAKFGRRFRWVGDPYIMGRMLDMEAHGLKDMIAEVFKYDAVHIEDILPLAEYDFTQADPEDPRVVMYTSGQFSDAVATLKLDTLLRERIAKEGMSAVYMLEVSSAVLMAEQALTGYRVDVDRWKSALSGLEADEAVAKFEAAKVLGKINLDSPVQITKTMNARGIHSSVLTETLKQSWSLEALEKLPACPEVDVLRGYKQVAATLRAIRSVPLPEDGVLRPRWRSIGVHGSARMFSESPSLTTLPKLVRTAFTAAPGRTWVGIGYDTMTPRLLAYLSGDEHLTRLVENDDAYRGFETLAADPSGSRARGKDAFFEYLVTAGGGPAGFEWAGHLLAKATAYLVGVREQAMGARMVVTLMGRKRVLTGPADSGEQGRSVLARFFQQCSATQVKAALVRAASLCSPTEMQDLVVMPDKVYYTVPTDYLREHMAAVVPCFEDAYFPQRVRLPITVRTGNSWGNLEDL
jgi:DNA polymerase I-like protein with 3'-5' exonuclease and polymerase domains